VQAKEEGPYSKPVKGNTPKPKTEETPSVHAQREGIKNEIGGIITAASKSGESYFTEDEKEQARQIIKTTKHDEKGLRELQELKGFLSDELSKREKKAA